MNRNGVIWYCTKEGLVRIEGKNWQVFNGQNTPELAGKYNKTKTLTLGLAVDSNENLWVLSYDHAVSYDGKSWTTFDSSNSPLKNIERIDVDRDGTAWFSCLGALVRKDSAGWTTFDENNSAVGAQTYVRGIWMDDEKTNWVATSKGIIKIIAPASRETQRVISGPQWVSGSPVSSSK
jgi:ligand-binding sensor domain-containing protein